MVANRGCITRLSRYKNAAIRLKALNFVRVFSDNLADAAGVTASQVRKDFSIFGITGNRRGGYQIEELIKQLNKVLGKDEEQNFIIVGVGNIGKALLTYQGFEKTGIRISAGFDIDPEKFDETGEVPVFGLDKLSEYVSENDIEMAIISVPDYAAQQVLEILVGAGIRGVLNFAPIRLRKVDNVVINNINLEAELENMIYFVKAADKAQDTK